MSLPAVLYASTGPRQEVISKGAHSTCLKDSCVARTINEETYQTAHVCDNQTCEILESPLERVKEVLDNGDIPVIQISRTNDNRYELTVSSNKKTKYIAISHVWADGLGCVGKNELPVCQIARLYSLCSSVHESAYNKIFNANLYDIYSGLSETPSNKIFSLSRLTGKRPQQQESPVVSLWIDTLCVPRPKQYRRLAIARMSATYALASKVLILDSEMLALSLSLPPTDLLVRILGIGWMRRVWMMQEGVLGSKHLYIQLGDGVFDVQRAVFHVRRAARTQVNGVGASVVDRNAVVFFDEIVRVRDAYASKGFELSSYMKRTGDKHKNERCEGGGMAAALVTALNALNRRATTNAGDAYLCLAGMMGMGGEVVGELFNAPVEQRTRVLLSRLKYVPEGIIFSPGRKLVDRGFRWACASFWESKILLPQFLRREYARFEPGGPGLRVEYEGFVLEPLEGPRSPATYLLFQHRKTWYKATYDPSCNPQETIDDADDDEQFPPQLGVICSNSDVVQDGPRGSHTPAVLVALLKGEEKDLLGYFNGDMNKQTWCRYICRVTVSIPLPGDLLNAATVGKVGRPNWTSDESKSRPVFIPKVWCIS